MGIPVRSFFIKKWRKNNMEGTNVTMTAEEMMISVKRPFLVVKRYLNCHISCGNISLRLDKVNGYMTWRAMTGSTN